MVSVQLALMCLASAYLGVRLYRRLTRSLVRYFLDDTHPEGRRDKAFRLATRLLR
jgi:hypothetical protein